MEKKYYFKINDQHYDFMDDDDDKLILSLLKKRKDITLFNHLKFVLYSWLTYSL